MSESNIPSGGVKVTGTPSMSELQSSPGFPSEERIKKGPVAVIECVEKIPCNPCEAACSVHHAICIGKDITSLPDLDEDICTGCGLCIAPCPGLAIHVLDYTFETDRASILFPYEYLPLPENGQIVQMTDRLGEVICDGEILKVTNSKRNNKTAIIKAAFNKKYYKEAVSMKRLPSVINE